MRLKSEIKEDLNHIRAKVLNILMKLLGVKLVRLARNNERGVKRWLGRNQELRFV